MGRKNGKNNGRKRKGGKGKRGNKKQTTPPTTSGVGAKLPNVTRSSWKKESEETDVFLAVSLSGAITTKNFNDMDNFTEQKNISCFTNCAGLKTIFDVDDSEYSSFVIGPSLSGSWTTDQILLSRIWRPAKSREVTGRLNLDVTGVYLLVAPFKDVHRDIPELYGDDVFSSKQQITGRNKNVKDEDENGEPRHTMCPYELTLVEKLRFQSFKESDNVVHTEDDVICGALIDEIRVLRMNEMVRRMMVINAVDRHNLHYCGEGEKHIERAMGLQSSQICLFFCTLQYLYNVMASNNDKLYTESLHYISGFNAEGQFVVNDDEEYAKYRKILASVTSVSNEYKALPFKIKLAKCVRGLASCLSMLLRVVCCYTTDMRYPWNGANLFPRHYNKIFDTAIEIDTVFKCSLAMDFFVNHRAKAMRMFGYETVTTWSSIGMVVERLARMGHQCKCAMGPLQMLVDNGSIPFVKVPDAETRKRALFWEIQKETAEVFSDMDDDVPPPVSRFKETPSFPVNETPFVSSSESESIDILNGVDIDYLETSVVGVKRAWRKVLIDETRRFIDMGVKGRSGLMLTQYHIDVNQYIRQLGRIFGCNWALFLDPYSCSSRLFFEQIMHFVMAGEAGGHPGTCNNLHSKSSTFGITSNLLDVLGLGNSTGEQKPDFSRKSSVVSNEEAKESMEENQWSGLILQLSDLKFQLKNTSAKIIKLQKQRNSYLPHQLLRLNNRTVDLEKRAMEAIDELLDLKLQSNVEKTRLYLSFWYRVFGPSQISCPLECFVERHMHDAIGRPKPYIGNHVLKEPCGVDYPMISLLDKRQSQGYVYQHDDGISMSAIILESQLVGPLEQTYPGKKNSDKWCPESFGAIYALLLYRSDLLFTVENYRVPNICVFLRRVLYFWGKFQCDRKRAGYVCNQMRFSTYYEVALRLRKKKKQIRAVNKIARVFRCWRFRTEINKGRLVYQRKTREAAEVLTRSVRNYLKMLSAVREESSTKVQAFWRCVKMRSAYKKAKMERYRNLALKEERIDNHLRNLCLVLKQMFTKEFIGPIESRIDVVNAVLPFNVILSYLEVVDIVTEILSEQGVKVDANACKTHKVKSCYKCSGLAIVEVLRQAVSFTSMLFINSKGIGRGDWFWYINKLKANRERAALPASREQEEQDVQPPIPEKTNYVLESAPPVQPPYPAAQGPIPQYAPPFPVPHYQHYQHFPYQYAQHHQQQQQQYLGCVNQWWYMGTDGRWYPKYYQGQDGFWYPVQHTHVQ